MSSLHTALETYRGHTVPHFRLIERRNFWFVFSGAWIVLSLVGIFWQGLTFSIDFRGGAQVTYPMERPVTPAEVNELLAENGFAEAEVQIVDGSELSLRTESISGEGQRADQLLNALAEQAGTTRAEVSVEDIGPTWGSQLSSQAIRGLVIVLVLILLYFTWRFEWAMGVSGIVALLHDIVITAGIYALVGRDVAPETVIAILTIMGFSLYDTVVIFDKVQENLESPALMATHGYDGVVTLSLNTVFMRSVNTSLVVLLPILAMLLYGGDTLKDFAFAMFVGTAAGTYSSIFVAAPLLTVIKSRNARVRASEERRLAREQRGAAAPASSSTSASSTAASTTGASSTDTSTSASGGARAARPPSKSRKRPPAKRKRR